MSAGLLLIDGYNLLHAAGMAQQDYRPGDLLRCRTRLLRFLLERLSLEEIKAATIVFDARDPPPDRPAELVVSGLKVLFASGEGDADAFIQEWLSQHRSPRRVTVVSSDRVLQRAARGYGAKFVSSRDFLCDLERRSSRDSKPDRSPRHIEEQKPAGAGSAAQVAYWLKVFGEIPADEYNAADEPSPPRPAPKNPKSVPKPATARRPRRLHVRQQHDDAKPTGKITADEMAAWLGAFDDTPTGSSHAPFDVRLADLESWIKQFEATEEAMPNQPRRRNRG